MGILVCPICKKELNKIDKKEICENKHSFDYAKEGYLNLHISKNSKNPGDDKVMVNSRRDFLDKGFYAEISEKVNELLKSNITIGDKLLDVGAGEGYYTNKMAKALNEVEVFALDISKEAVKKGAKTYKNIKWLVASGLEEPFKDKSFKGITVLFSKLFSKEFKRVLDDEGFLIIVSPNREHLVDIKKVVYPMIKYENIEPIDELKDDFELVKRENLFYKKAVHGEDIKNLFHMTPYRWKSPKDGVERLESLNYLEVTVDVNVDVYRKKDLCKS